MEDFYMNITSQNNSYDYSNITSNYSNNTDDYDGDWTKVTFILNVVIICIGLPLTLVAIYALYSRIQNGHVAPIYIINLLISDIIQLCFMMIFMVPIKDLMTGTIFIYSYIYTLMVSVVFMVCIALERYLVITHPLWYRFRRTIKISVGVCVLVWVLPLVLGTIFIFWVTLKNLLIIFGIFFLLPLPLFIFFLGGTLRVLSTTRVPSDEKRRIVAVLVLVLLIYTLLFLPGIILSLSQGVFNITFTRVSLMFLRFSPLADLTLYVFMRKGIMDKFLSSVCCCRMDSDDTNSSANREDTNQTDTDHQLI